MNSLYIGLEVWCDSCTESVIAVDGEDSGWETLCPKCDSGYYLESL